MRKVILFVVFLLGVVGATQGQKVVSSNDSDSIVIQKREVEKEKESIGHRLFDRVNDTIEEIFRLIREGKHHGIFDFIIIMIFGIIAFKLGYLYKKKKINDIVLTLVMVLVMLSSMFSYVLFLAQHVFFINLSLIIIYYDRISNFEKESKTKD